MRAMKLPKRLKGPFTNAFYSRRDGIIYLKKENGELESTRAYPSFFIPKSHKDRFPASEFSKNLLDWIDEGDYWRVVIDPSTRRDTITDMVETAEEEGCKVLEADVSPVRRWFSDTGALVSTKFRCLFFDLETHPLQIGFDDEAKKRHRIISFAAYDADGKSWFYAANKSSDEEELKVIKEFFKIAKDYDVLLAWNGDDYDFFVLRARCKYHKLRIDWRLWNWLDHMRVVKKLLMSISDPAFKRSFALDKVGENVLGLRKLHTSVSGGNLHKLLGRKVAELEAYNRRDVEIMLGIEQKREFLTLQFALCSLCRTFPNRGSTFPNELADGTLLRLAVQEGIHFPSRKRKEINEDYEKYEGAFVLDPKVGFHTSIQVPDFASLYPSIILSWNMSNETKINDGEDYPPNVSTDHAVATATGIRFRTDIEGIIPKALRQLISKRNEYKQRGKSLDLNSEEYRTVGHLSTAVKVVTNSFYGLLGNEGSRYHDRDIARSVTLTGQLLIREHIRYFERKGFETVAGDSITGSQTVVLRDAQQRIIIDKIENVWPGCIYSKHGKEYSTLDGWYALSANSTWQPVKAIIRHRTNKNIWEIRNKHGHVEVTEDHSFVVDNERVTPQKVFETEYFETINAPPSRTWGCVDLISELHDKSFSYPYKNRHVIRHFETLHNGHITLKGWGSTPQIFRRYYKRNSPELHALLRITAGYITEGSASLIHETTESRTLFSISNQESNWLDNLRNDLFVVAPFAHINKPRWSEGSGTYYIRSSAEIAYFFAALCGYKSEGKRLPSFIYELDDIDWNVFWTTLNEGDGSIEYDQYSYSSKSAALTAGISYCLSQRSIRHSIHYREEKNAWKIRTISDRFSHRPTKTFCNIRQSQNEWVYDLSIENTESFVGGIGRVHLHNTDSVFVNCSESQMNLMLRDLNDNFIPSLLERVGCRECAVRMDFDKGYKSLLIVTKKRYAGKLSLHKGRPAPEDLEPEIKGLEFQRSDNARYAQRLQLEYVNLLLNPDVNPDVIDMRLREDGQYFFQKDLELEEIVITKGVSKHPSEYKPMTTAAKVAQWLIDEGQEFFVGMKIPYVVIGHKPGISAIHADEFKGNLDRHYYWEKLILPPILRLIRARFPNYGFSDFKQPLQMQFDFANQATTSRKVSKRVTAKKIVKKAKKVTKKVRQVANPTYNIKIPSHAGVPTIKGIAALAKSQPGKYKLDITVDLKSLKAEVDIETEQCVTMDCLKQIKQMFPKVTITPEPL